MKDFIEAMTMYGLSANDGVYTIDNIQCMCKGHTMFVRHGNTIFASRKVENILKYIECSLHIGKFSSPIMAAINTKNLAQNLVRVRSSNVWAVGFNVRNKGDNVGDLLMQFKGKNGGAGDLYIYYMVPVKVYRRLLNSPSVGHFVWTDIRNNYKYSRLTGTKRGVLPNAINNW